MNERWHFSTSRIFNQTFGDRVILVISHFCGHQVPPDLTTMEFWLWGYVKFKVYQFHPQTVSYLMDAIRTAIQEIPIAMIRAAVLSTICHMQSVIVCEGDHVENL